MKRILKSNLIEILPSLLLLILTLYATYTIIISIDLIGKTYFIGKMFKVKVASINLKVDELEAKIIINYTIINPIDISIKILSIQSIIYSDNTYIWNNIESYYSREIIIKSTVITEIIKFTIPQEKLKYISNKFSIKTYIICERITIMYLGKIVEMGDIDRVLEDPKHPYTQALVSAVPIPDPEYRRSKIPIKGEIPSALNPPSGCRFHPRCPYAM